MKHMMLFMNYYATWLRHASYIPREFFLQWIIVLRQIIKDYFWSLQEKGAKRTKTFEFVSHGRFNLNYTKYPENWRSIIGIQVFLWGCSVMLRSGMQKFVWLTVIEVELIAGLHVHKIHWKQCEYYCWNPKMHLPQKAGNGQMIPCQRDSKHWCGHITQKPPLVMAWCQHSQT